MERTARAQGGNWKNLPFPPFHPLPVDLLRLENASRSSFSLCWRKSLCVFSECNKESDSTFRCLLMVGTFPFHIWEDWWESLALPVLGPVEDSNHASPCLHRGALTPAHPVAMLTTQASPLFLHPEVHFQISLGSYSILPRKLNSLS